MGKHPRLRWKDATMKGRLKKLLAAGLTRIADRGLSGTDLKEESDDDEKEIFTVKIERKDLKETNVGCDEQLWFSDFI